jgi:hypothetical protein
MTQSARRTTISAIALFVGTSLLTGAALPSSSVGEESRVPVCLTVDQMVSPGIRAEGFVILSGRLKTPDAVPTTVRVLSFWITVTREGSPPYVFKGAPFVDVQSGAPSAGGLNWGSGNPAQPGESELPTRVGVSIQPTPGNNWGDVARAEDVVVQVEWALRTP